MKLRLQELRKEAGFKSAKSFAESVGINPNTYTAYEQKKVAMKFDTACFLAEKLNCTLDEMAGKVASVDYLKNKKEKQLVDDFRTLNENEADAALAALHGIAQNARRNKESEQQNVARVS